ncbi:hypothetical protein PORCRE_214 [Porphyromonas crevioricanis JCM 15906]|uniref:Uncharacterized protein n=1 Tax=Porphyromonas crevioricanis JCM 15906 TaxID=1305617 RepID=S4N6Q5_9PORP|nr:DUF5686 family protein [Porphyromonas crevioricanis]GAD04528.1 hypothetical protein PORCRE_214 [Porphyromonas crevioricanis JCM 15906]
MVYFSIRAYFKKTRRHFYLLLFLVFFHSTWMLASETDSSCIYRPKLIAPRVYRLMPQAKSTAYGAYRCIDSLDARFAEKFGISSEIEDERGSTRQKFLDAGMAALFGYNFQLDSCWMLGVDGLGFAFPEVNSTDGIWCGYELIAAYKPRAGYALHARGNAYYTTGRKKVVWHSYLGLHYTPERDGMLFLGLGQSSGGYNLLNGHQSYLLDYIEPALGNEPTRTYERDWLMLRNEIELNHWLGIDFTSTFEHRRPIVDSAWYGSHRAFCTELRLRFHPLANVQISPAGRAAYISPLGYRIPELSVAYRRAWPLGGDLPSSDYSRLEVMLRGTYDIDSRQYMHYALGAGAYIGKMWRSEQDLKYVSTANTVGFSQMSYRFQTITPARNLGERWLSIYLNYETSIFPLAKAMGRKGFPLDEAIHFKAIVSRYEEPPLLQEEHLRYLGKRETSVWTEYGYSLGIGDLMRVGFFLGFDRHRYSSLAFRVSVPLLQLYRFWGERD